MKRANFILVTVLALGMTAGCHRGPKGVTPIGGHNAPMPNPKAAGPSTPGGIVPGRALGTDEPNTSRINPLETTALKTTGSGIEGANPEGRENMVPDREAFRAQTIYFDYDRATVKSSDRSNLESVAAYLKNEPKSKVEVEGHCDERGTEEYNRALGERRALAAREALVSLGVGPDRIFTTSFGEDRPADPGHDETAWSKNRRDEFILLKPRQ